MPTYTKTVWANGGVPAINATNLGNIEAGIFNSYDTGIVEVDSYTGTDDEKLTAAMAYAAAQTYKPTLRLSSREWNFSTQRTLYTGFKITGSGAPGSVEQPRSNNPYATQVSISTGSNLPWLQVTSNVYGCYIGNMAVEGTSSSVFIGSNGGTLWTSVMENLGFSAFRSVLGSTDYKLLMTACTLQGWWNINNSYRTAIVVGGSDNTLFSNGCLLDSGDAFNSSSLPYHAWFDYCEKTWVGPMYITAEAWPAAIRVTGSNSYGALIFTGIKAEGRNSTEASYGSVVRVEGGQVTFRDCWFGHAYTSPGSSGRTSEGGMVTVLGGRVLFDGCYVARSSSFAETNPVIYASGSSAKVTVRNMEACDEGATWVSLPLVSAVSSATAVVDSSVRTS